MIFPGRIGGVGLNQTLRLTGPHAERKHAPVPGVEAPPDLAALQVPGNHFPVETRGPEDVTLEGHA